MTVVSENDLVYALKNDKITKSLSKKYPKMRRIYRGKTTEFTEACRCRSIRRT